MNRRLRVPYPRFILSLMLSVFIASMGLAPGRLAAQELALPNIGDSGASKFTPEQEHRVGQNALNHLRRQHAVLRDPIVDSYVQNLGYKLVSASNTDQRHFYFFVVADSGINAFAMPGGYIGVNYGLILDTQSESELAAVMAHEIGHVVQRHFARTYQDAKGNNMINIAALVAAIVLASKNDQAGEAAMASAAAGSAQSQLTTSRSHEEEADRVGIALLDKAGFDPEAMADFFQRMQKSTRLYGPELPQFLRDHPVTTERIADARNRAAQMPHHRVHEHESYFLIRARLRVLTDGNIHATVASFKRNLAQGNYSDEDAERYGYALALTRAGRYDAALTQTKRLLAKDPNRIAYIVAQAQAEAGAGRARTALNIYRDALQLSPYNRVLTHYYVSELLAANQAGRATRFLHRYLQNAAPHAGTYHLLARAEGQAGNAVASQIAMADYYNAIGEVRTAIGLLQTARRTKGLSFYYASRIDAKLAQFKDKAAALPAR